MVRNRSSWLLLVPLFLACSASDVRPPGGGAVVSDGGTGGSPAAAAGSGNSPAASAGSGNALNVGDGTKPDAGDVMNGECAHKDFDLSRQPAEILIVLDRSGSMKEVPSGSTGTTKWSLVVPGVNEVVTATDASVSWGLKVFPEGEGKECIAASVTSAIPVPIAANNAAAVTAQVTATTPEGNGTPTGDAIKAAVTYLKTLSSTNPKFILLATDGEPSCAGTTKDSGDAHTYAVQAVTDAASAGIKTVVVGVATTKSSATRVLNEMAVAGQMARTDSTSPDTKFYLASTKDELVKALEQITGQVSGCVFELSSTPPDPDNIAVHVNDMTAPRDATRMNGWDYTSADNNRVEIYGSWCDQIKSATSRQVNFVLGCPNEIIQ